MLRDNGQPLSEDDVKNTKRKLKRKNFRYNTFFQPNYLRSFLQEKKSPKR